MDKAKAIKELLDDKNYYGDFGSKYLSNSDIIFLLKILHNSKYQLKNQSL